MEWQLRARCAHTHSSALGKPKAWKMGNAILTRAAGGAAANRRNIPNSDEIRALNMNANLRIF
jgi:hypothetical protein